MLVDYQSLFKNRDFIYLWTSQIFSQITINILNFIILFRIFDATGSTIATSMLWVAYALPALLIGPLAAASVDILDRKKVLVITNAAQGSVIFLYALTQGASIYLLYGLAITYSFLNQFYVPAELAILPSLLKKKSLAQANGLFFLTQQASVIVGFGTAGFLSATLGFSRTLYLCSLLLFIAFASVFRLPDTKVTKELSKDLEQSLKKYYSTIAGGYKYIRKNNYVLAPLVLMLFLHTSLTIGVVNIPVIATDVFNIPVTYAGVLLAVPAGVGAGLGAILIPKLLKSGVRKIRAIELSLMLMVVDMFFILFLIPELSGIVKVSLEILFVALLGVSFTGVLIPSQTFLQENTPSAFRGRVFGNFWFLSILFSVFPVIFSGTVTEIFGIKYFLFIITSGAFVILMFIKKYGYKYIKEDFSFKQT